jgi:hypothetical protein
MLFLAAFPFCFAFCWLVAHLVDVWNQQDLAQLRATINQENGEPLMYLENYYMPCRPVSRDRDSLDE